MTTSSETADLQRRIYRRWAPVYDRLYAGILKQAHRILAQRASAHGGDVLEIGVGTGLGLPYYHPARKLVGIDISEEMLARAQEKRARLNLQNVSLRVMDAHRLEFSDATFDVVTLPFVLTLVAKPEAVLCECARVTKPGGAIIIASRISRGGVLQSKLERAVAPVARRIGLSSSFHLSTIQQWNEEHGGVLLDAVEDLRPMGFFKLVAIHRKAD